MVETGMNPQVGDIWEWKNEFDYTTEIYLLLKRLPSETITGKHDWYIYDISNAEYAKIVFGQYPAEWTQLA